MPGRPGIGDRCDWRPTAIDAAERRIYSVAQLNQRARQLLETHFATVWVEGEISNLVRPSSGHWYFTLKDTRAQVRCAMFRNRNQRVRFKPGNGDHIRLRCRVSLYEGRGEFQLIVEHMEHAGAGALQAAFERLKARLQAEGLFNPERKRALPATVSSLGVVTSPTGAAIHDILTVLQRRCPMIEVSILPVAVQGEGAAVELVRGIAAAHALADAPDVLVIGRGGGSLEDLWCFNHEAVVRAISQASIPVVAAIGHEIDVTLSDLAADVRALQLRARARTPGKAGVPPPHQGDSPLDGRDARRCRHP